MKITVTQDDINNGVKGDVRHCPVALAIRRLFPDRDMRSGYGFAIDHSVQPFKIYRYSEGVSDSIHYFDIGRGMVPFEFELEI